MGIRVAVYTVTEEATYKVRITKTADGDPDPESWTAAKIWCLRNTSDTEYTDTDDADTEPTTHLSLSATLEKPGYKIVSSIGCLSPDSTFSINYIPTVDMLYDEGFVDEGEDSYYKALLSSPSKIACSIGYWIETGDAPEPEGIPLFALFGGM